MGVGGAEGDQESAGDVEGRLAKKEERYHRSGRRFFSLSMFTVVCCPSMTCAPDDFGCTVCTVLSVGFFIICKNDFGKGGTEKSMFFGWEVKLKEGK